MDSLPKNGKGEINYDQINEPGIYFKAMKSEFGGYASVILDEIIKDTKKQLEVASKNGDAIEKARAMKQIRGRLNLLNEVRLQMKASNSNATNEQNVREVNKSKENNKWVAILMAFVGIAIVVSLVHVANNADTTKHENGEIVFKELPDLKKAMYDKFVKDGVFKKPMPYDMFIQFMSADSVIDEVYEKIKDKTDVSREQLADVFENPARDVSKPTQKNPKINVLPKTILPHKQTTKSSYQTEKDRLISDGWTETKVSNGRMKKCYNVVSKTGDIDNYLDVYVGGNTDVAIKIMNYATGICIRYVYVNSNTSYRVSNIPEGRYYLKIAYGKEWYSKIENGQCIGRFLRSPLYKKGEDVLDYNLKYDYLAEQYNVPSYSVRLDVISSNRKDEFETSNITEDEFNR
jgi:hypothetical protein